MRRLLLVLTAALMLALCATAGAKTLYVAPAGSGAACTILLPCGSFDQAYRTAGAGDIVEVAAGRYGDQTFASPPAKAGTVTFQAALGASVHTGYLSVQGTSNLEVRDMQVDGWGVTKGSQHVVLRNLVALHLDAGGYIAGGVNDVQILGGEIGFIDPGDGLHFNNAGGGSNTNVLIDGLYMHDLTRNVNPAAHTDCIQTGDITGLTIRNSRFVNCATQGIFLNPYNGGATKDIVLEGNQFGPAQLGYYSLYVGAAVGVTVRVNTFTQALTVQAAASGVKVTGNTIGGMDSYGCSVAATNSDVFDGNTTNVACAGATNNTVGTTAPPPPPPVTTTTPVPPTTTTTPVPPPPPPVYNPTVGDKVSYLVGTTRRYGMVLLDLEAQGMVLVSRDDTASTQYVLASVTLTKR